MNRLAPFLLALRAAGEPTRLRILALLAGAELNVTELTRVLGQSQPRISRHLRLLCEAGLLERSQEGTLAFYRAAERGAGARLLRSLADLLPSDDPDLARDRERLEAIRGERAAAAARYFRENAPRWDAIRDLYVAEDDVERAMLAAVGDEDVETHLDLGTGTGRVLQVFAGRAARGIGIDSSREMLAVARTSLEQEGLRHCRVRHGDIHHLDVPAGSADLVTVHHVLHFLADPPAALAEAARALRPRGRLLVVDFAPHQLEKMRTEYAHRRLGFADDEVRGWLESAGLGEVRIRHLAATGRDPGDSLTVTLWSGVQDATAPAHYELEVA